MKKKHCFPEEAQLLIPNRYYSPEEIDLLLKEVRGYNNTDLKHFLIGFVLAVLLNAILFFVFLVH